MFSLQIMGMKSKFIFILIQAAVLSSGVLSAPTISTTESLVLVLTDEPKRANATQDVQQPKV